MNRSISLCVSQMMKATFEHDQRKQQQRCVMPVSMLGELEATTCHLISEDSQCGKHQTDSTTSLDSYFFTNIIKYFSTIVAKRFLFQFWFGLKNVFGAVFWNKSFDKYYYFKYYCKNNKIIQRLTKKQIIHVSIVKTRSVIFIVVDNTIVKNSSNSCSYYNNIIDLIVYSIFQMHVKDLHTFEFAKYYSLWCISYLIHPIYIKWDLILIIIAIANIQNEIISNPYSFNRLLIVVVIQTSLREQLQHEQACGDTQSNNQKMNIFIKIIFVNSIHEYTIDDHKKFKFFGEPIASTPQELFFFVILLENHEYTYKQQQEKRM